MLIPFTKSLLEFDKRVLEQGKVDPKKDYTLEQLEQKLFFNNIFISNTDEMFERHDCSGVRTEYSRCLNVYMDNIQNILDKVFEITKSMKRGYEIPETLGNRPFFDRIISTSNPETRFAQLPSPRILNLVELDTLTHLHIYYISFKRNVIYSLDWASHIYQELITSWDKGEIRYYPTIEYIIDYINKEQETDDTIAVRVTFNDKGEVVRVEYQGDNCSTQLVKMFGFNTFIIWRKHIFTDDIKYLIQRNQPCKKPVEVCQSKKYDIMDVFDHDILIEHPNDSFDTFLQFLESAVNHKDVKKISMTLYRIGNDQRIYQLLRQAIKKGIKIHINIELTARGEYVNYTWKSLFEKIGVTVTTYGNPGVKVHAKLLLIEFKNKWTKVAHIATGNYNPSTSNQYTDLGLFTSNYDVCKEVKKLFKVFRDKTIGRFPAVDFSLFLVSRYNLLHVLVHYIRKEAEKKHAGLITFKCNALDDPTIISELEKAANEGCRINLIVRGVCTWVPYQHNVIVKSVIWDKLEHSRVYSFGSENPIVYMGSLDPVTHKIHNRIETLVMVLDTDIEVKLCNYLNRYITTTKGSWLQMTDGTYIKEERDEL